MGLTFESALKPVQEGFMWSCCSFRFHLTRKVNHNQLSCSAYFCSVYLTQPATPPPQDKQALSAFALVFLIIRILRSS